jgi:hypothetical protein
MVLSAGHDKYSDLLYNFLFRPDRVELFDAPSEEQMTWFLESLVSIFRLSKQWTITDRLKNVPGFTSKRGIDLWSWQDGSTEGTVRGATLFLLGTDIDRKEWILSTFTDDLMGLNDSMRYISPELLTTRELVGRLIADQRNLVVFFKELVGVMVEVQQCIASEYADRLGNINVTLTNLERLEGAAAMMTSVSYTPLPRLKPIFQPELRSH